MRTQETDFAVNLCAVLFFIGIVIVLLLGIHVPWVRWEFLAVTWGMAIAALVCAFAMEAIDWRTETLRTRGGENHARTVGNNLAVRRLGDVVAGRCGRDAGGALKI
jgi:hypothetical protein